MPRPASGTFPVYFERYTNLVEANSAAEAINKYGSLFNKYKALPESKSDYAYAEGKWTLKEVLQHVIDTERIFGYRALCIARKDETPLPGFDENTYAQNSKAGNRSWQSLLDEMDLVRRSTDVMFSSFDDEQLNSKGITNNNPTTVLALVYITYGHLLHHLNIINERYL